MLRFNLELYSDEPPNCEPHALDQQHLSLIPALIITWGTDGIATHPGETFDAGSGYMPCPDYVITASHIGDLIRRDMGTRPGQHQMQHALSVHDPRVRLTWRVSDERPLENSDIAIYRVEPWITASTPQQAFDTWRRIFLLRTIEHPW